MRRPYPSVFKHLTGKEPLAGGTPLAGKQSKGPVEDRVEAGGGELLGSKRALAL